MDERDKVARADRLRYRRRLLGVAVAALFVSQAGLFVVDAAGLRSTEYYAAKDCEDALLERQTDALVVGDVNTAQRWMAKQEIKVLERSLTLRPNGRYVFKARFFPRWTKKKFWEPVGLCEWKDGKVLWAEREASITPTIQF